MRGQKIIREFFKIFHHHYALGIPDFDDDVDDGLYTFSEIIDEFKLIPSFNALVHSKYLVEILREGSFSAAFLTDHFSCYRKVEVIKFTDDKFKKRNRSFYYSDNDFGYFSYKKTFDGNHDSNLFSHQGAAITNIQHFISSCIVLNQRDKIIEMLNYFEMGNKNIGLLLQKVNQRRESINIYSFIYFRYLCKGGFVEIEDKLKYITMPTFIPTFTPSNKYSQFFEVFDVANEVNHSKDIITRYLKVYHILEYLAYRVKLVQIEVKARERKTFIREITSLNSDKEEPYIIDCFKNVFNADIATLKTNLRFTPALKQYIEKQFGIKAADFNSIEYIPKLIYRLRNSIVHNKESEFHITVSNPDEYRQIISFIQRIITNLEKIFYNRMNEPHLKINYISSSIELY